MKSFVNLPIGSRFFSKLIVLKSYLQSSFVVVMILLINTSISNPVFAYSLKCNPAQSTCQVKTRRLVTGDYVGVFDSSGYMVAIGKVVEISGAHRKIKLISKYGTIYAKDEAKRIEDHKVKSPEKYFKLLKPVPNDAIGIEIDAFQMSIGKGMTGNSIEVFYEAKTKKSFYLLGRLGYASASGEASQTDEEIVSYDVNVSAVMLMAGVAYQLFADKFITVRTEASVGFVSVSGKSSGGSFDVVVDGRIKDGGGIGFKGQASLLVRTGDFRPYIGGNVHLINNSINPGMHIGVYF